MSERPEKRRGPIGFLMGLYEDDPPFARLLILTAAIFGTVAIVVFATALLG